VAIVYTEPESVVLEPVRYVLDGIIPAYGMLVFLVAYAKVGKTTFGKTLAAHLAPGRGVPRPRRGPDEGLDPRG